MFSRKFFPGVRFRNEIRGGRGSGEKQEEGGKLREREGERGRKSERDQRQAILCASCQDTVKSIRLNSARFLPVGFSETDCQRGEI